MGKNKDTMRRVLKFISPYKGKIILMLLMALFTVAFTLYTPILIGEGVDTVSWALGMSKQKHCSGSLVLWQWLCLERLSRNGS